MLSLRHPRRPLPLLRLLAVLTAPLAACGGGSEPGTPVDSTAGATAEPARLANDTTSVNWSAVDSAMGRPGLAQTDGVRRFNFPRSDLRVTVQDSRGDVVLRPALALGGWVAMHPTGETGQVMAMGDVVVTEDELPRVMSKLQDGGVEQTAVHHHVMRETPRVLYMHIHARGEALSIARTVREAVALTGAPQPASTAASTTSSAVPPSAAADLDTAGITSILGHTGRSNGGVYQVSAPRPEPITAGGHPVPGVMGLGTVMNFQPTGAGRAAITGDFVMTASEVNRVIRALRSHGIEITSLHNHMLDDEPRLFFMHFWAHDDALALARGLRAGLDSTGIRPRAP